MKRLPAETMFAELQINPQRWLGLGVDDKDRLISVYLTGRNAFIPLAARQTIAAGADEYARYVVRPAGDPMGNFSVSANAGGGGSIGNTSGGSTTGDSTASTSTGAGGDPWLKILNTALSVGIPAAIQLFNGLNATDQARIHSEAEQNIARITSSGAQTQQDQQLLTLSQALSNQKKGLSTGVTIALVAGGIVLVGGLAYLALRPRSHRNPVIREGGRKKFISAPHARARRARRHRTS